MTKKKQVKIKSAQELYRLDNVKFKTSSCGTFCSVVVNDKYMISYGPGEVFTVVQSPNRNIHEGIIAAYPEIFEEVEG